MLRLNLNCARLS